MANVLKPEKQEQIRALGRLGWTLRRIEEETGVHTKRLARTVRNPEEKPGFRWRSARFDSLTERTEPRPLAGRSRPSLAPAPRAGR